jgi:hypothetical protein
VSLAPKCNDAWFVGAIQRVQRRFKAMIYSINDGRYFDAWLAAVQVRTALEHATQFADVLPDATRVSAVNHLDTMRSIAAPFLALAPSPTRDELRALRTSDPEANRLAWERVEQRWRHALVCVCADDKPSAPSRPARSSRGPAHRTAGPCP